MRWKGRRQSLNIEYKTSLLLKIIVGLGIGITAIVLIVVLLGVDPSSLFKNIFLKDQSTSSTTVESAEDRELKHFISAILSEANDFWSMTLHNSEITYRRPELVLCNGKIDSVCGIAGSVRGSFYCPDDETIYIDLSFHDELHKQVDASCHFALIYVIAHEVGHHIQKLTGVIDKVQSQHSKMGKEEYNQYSLRLELQADFYAGVWAHHSHRLNLLEESDIKAALNDASEAGYELIHKGLQQGYLVLDSFTHGTAEQRIKWFYKGFTTGDYKQGDTFSTDEL